MPDCSRLSSSPPAHTVASNTDRKFNRDTMALNIIRLLQTERACVVRAFLTPPGP